MQTSNEYYTLKIAGLERSLPICRLNDEVSIAGFVMFGDVELTVKVSQILLERCPDFDIILTAESKGIPLAYELARISQKPYIVARKSVKLYMKNPTKMDVKSISTENPQVLYLDEKDMADIKSKRVLIVDDVVSTGESLEAMVSFARQAGGEIAAMAAVLAEGDAANREDIIFIEELPLIFG